MRAPTSNSLVNINRDAQPKKKKILPWELLAIVRKHSHVVCTFHCIQRICSPVQSTVTSTCGHACTRLKATAPFCGFNEWRNKISLLTHIFETTKLSNLIHEFIQTILFPEMSVTSFSRIFFFYLARILCVSKNMNSLSIYSIHSVGYEVQK